jgi:hypothetical protein
LSLAAPLLLAAAPPLWAQVAASSEDAAAPPARAGVLGTTEEELRAQFGDALRSVKLERPLALTEQIAAARGGSAAAEPSETGAAAAEPPDPFAEQVRLAREVGSRDVRRVEYELFRGRVYRVRWQLDDRFERPIMDSLVARLRERFGKPAYDQTIEGKFASGRATLRRAAWRRETRVLEVRQLHPLNGGPLFLTLSDEPALRAIVASRGTVAPEPESSGPWWQEPQKPTGIPTSQERDSLLQSVDGLLSRIPF